MYGNRDLRICSRLPMRYVNMRPKLGQLGEAEGEKSALPLVLPRFAEETQGRELWPIRGGKYGVIPVTARRFASP
jgi:hypothetical protein